MMMSGPSPNPVPAVGHFNRTLLGHFWRAAKVLCFLFYFITLNYYVRVRTVFEDDVKAMTITAGKRRWVPLRKTAAMALTGLARKVLTRAHLL